MDTKSTIEAQNQILSDKLYELEKQNTQLQEAEGIFNFGSWDWHIASNMVRWSAGMFKLFELNVNDYPGQIMPRQFYRQFVVPEEREKFIAFSDGLLTSGLYNQEHTHTITDTNGNRKIVLVKAKCFFDESGSLKNIVGVCADISKEQAYQLELQSQLAKIAASNKELEQFAYIASHDLQEPLRKIKTFGDQLVKKFGNVLDEEGNYLISRMQAASQRMSRLIDDLLKYSRATRPVEQWQLVGLQEVVKNVLDDLELKIKEKNAQIKVGALPTIEAQAFQMQQLFQNIIENSLKFADAGRALVININAEKVDATQDLTSLANVAGIDIYKITISDTGIGFDQAYAEKIFTLFHRLHGRAEYEGSGLGLSICKKIAETHKGHIEAHGEQAVGSTFTIYLPKSQK